MSKHAYIAPSAEIGSNIADIGANTQIGGFTKLAAGVRIGQRCQIGAGTSIGNQTIIRHDVHIGRNVKIGDHVLICNGAHVCTGRVTTHSSDACIISSDSIIGPQVTLHDEVELGYSAIVPNQRTIAHLGFFGSKNRVVTIYGHEEGPKYSIGCQIGVDFDTVLAHVNNSVFTHQASSQTYVPYLPVFNEIGAAVQKAYDESYREKDDLVAEYAKRFIELAYVVEGI